MKKANPRELAQRTLEKIRFMEESFKAIAELTGGYPEMGPKDLDLNGSFYCGAASLLGDIAVEMNDLANVLPLGKEGDPS